MYRHMLYINGRHMVPVATSEKGWEYGLPYFSICSYILIESFATRVCLYTTCVCFKNLQKRASLVAQWLRICLPMQGTRVRAPVWEDPTYRGAAGPVSHNY